LDGDEFTELGDLKMFTVDGPKSLLGSFPMGEGKKFGVDNGCCYSSIK